MAFGEPAPDPIEVCIGVGEPAAAQLIQIIDHPVSYTHLTLPTSDLV